MDIQISQIRTSLATLILARAIAEGYLEVSRNEGDADVAWVVRPDGKVLSIGEYNSFDGERDAPVLTVEDDIDYPIVALCDLSLMDLAMLVESKNEKKYGRVDESDIMQAWIDGEQE